ncbi:MAG TPA: hypothetical protein VJ831_12975 [Jatrophihabitantaceae bacterium]|nr:hypothetical protein [Jatrophihabitantaceae bacterium]
MNSKRTKLATAMTALVTAGAATFALASPSTSLPAQPQQHSRPWTTPNECVAINHGDYIACNVGNSGSGNLPYRPVQAPSVKPATPNECVAINHGDYNACNVGNSGRGDAPYRTQQSKTG